MKINRERDRALAVGGRQLAKQCNDQLLVGISGGRCIGEETRLGWNVWGDTVLLFLSLN
jgi:hypothetical protein